MYSNHHVHNVTKSQRGNDTRPWYSTDELQLASSTSETSVGRQIYVVFQAGSRLGELVPSYIRPINSTIEEHTSVMQSMHKILAGVRSFGRELGRMLRPEEMIYRHSYVHSGPSKLGMCLASGSLLYATPAAEATCHGSQFTQLRIFCPSNVTSKHFVMCIYIYIYVCVCVCVCVCVS